MHISQILVQHEALLSALASLITILVFFGGQAKGYWFWRTKRSHYEQKSHHQGAQAELPHLRDIEISLRIRCGVVIQDDERRTTLAPTSLD